MRKKYPLFAVIFAVSILIGIQAVEVVNANPVPWPTTPILDNPTITIHSPSNNTVYTNGNTTISLTVTNPDSWKRGGLIPIPSYYALVDSVGAYLDGKRILLAHNYTVTDYTSDEWVKDESYFYVPSITAAGQHMLNVTVVSRSYYRGPAYNGSHIVSDWMSSDGPVYQYPIVVSELVYFTIVGEPSPSPSPLPSSQEIGAFPIETVSVVSLAAIAVVGAGLLVYFKRKRGKL
jgi:hypothetical protein